MKSGNIFVPLRNFVPRVGASQYPCNSRALGLRQSPNPFPSRVALVRFSFYVGLSRYCDISTFFAPSVVLVLTHFTFPRASIYICSDSKQSRSGENRTQLKGFLFWEGKRAFFLPGELVSDGKQKKKGLPWSSICLRTDCTDGCRSGTLSEMR